MPNHTPEKDERFAQAWGRYRPRVKLFKNPFAVIPMIDTAFILLVFLAAGSAFVTQPGVMVELPDGRFADGSHYGNMIVTLTQEGFVFFNDERVRTEDLEYAFTQAAHKDKNASLIIEADHRVHYGAVAQVMAMADSAGIRRVNLALTPSTAGQQAPLVKKP